MGSQLSLSFSQLQSIYYELDSDNKCPNLNKIGKITKEGEWNHIVNGLCHKDQPRWLVLLKKINHTFAKLEQKGVKIFDPTIEDEAYIEKARQYHDNTQLYCDLVEIIGEHLKSIPNLDNELKKSYHELKCREMGLLYSLGKENMGIDPLDDPEQEILDDLNKRAQEWLEGQALARVSEQENIVPQLNLLMLKKLKEIAKYPKWLQVVYEDKKYLEEVFNWCLRDDNSVEIMVKCYETRRRLKAALLSANLGYVSNRGTTDLEEDVLAFRTMSTKIDGVSKRILTAAIYHGDYHAFEPDKQERINILKPDEMIHFQKGDYTLTVDEFLREMGQKNARESNINLCADWGFVNFHPVHGIWSAEKQSYEMPPEMTEANWWDHVPPSKVVTHEELFAQYGEEVQDRSFFFKTMSTRQHLDLNALDCHAFWQFYFRMKDGNWKVLNVGCYAYRFQRGLLDGLWLFCATLKRVLSLMDQNGYYTHRQRAAYPIFPNEEAGNNLLNRIFRLMHSNGVFQFCGRNCAYPVQKITEKFIQDLPNFFYMPLYRVKTDIRFLDKVLVWADQQGRMMRWLILSVLQLILLSHRQIKVQKKKGEVIYSVREYLKKTYDIHNPGYLAYQTAQAHQIGTGPFLKGEIYWSHTEEKLFQDDEKIFENKRDEEEK